MKKLKDFVSEDVNVNELMGSKELSDINGGKIKIKFKDGISITCEAAICNGGMCTGGMCSGGMFE